MSASTTHQLRTRASLTAKTACPALRLGRYPYEHGRKFASKSGSMTILHACWTTRSRTVGTDACDHQVSGSPPAAQGSGDTSPPSSLLRAPEGTPRRRGVRSLRSPRHRPRERPRSPELLPRPATEHRAGRCGHTERGTVGSDSSWPQDTVGAGVLVTFLAGVVGSCEHAPSLPSPLDAVEAGGLPSGRFCCPCLQRYYLPLRLLTKHRLRLRIAVLIPSLPRAVDPRPREISLVALMAIPAFRSPYAEEFFGAALPDSSPLPWPSLCMNRSALLCSPLGANMSALQDSLHGTDCWFAPPSQRDTPLHHLRSPGSSGSLLRGSLAITTTGLPPVSHQNLQGTPGGGRDVGIRARHGDAGEGRHRGAYSPQFVVGVRGGERASGMETG